MNEPLVFSCVLILGGTVLSGGFTLGWWLRARVADRIDDERQAVAQQVAQAVMVRVHKPGPN